MQQQQQPQEREDSQRGGFLLFYAAVNLYYLVTAPLLQTDFGCEFFRYAWVTLGGMVAWGAHAKSPAVLAYAGVWLVALACQRVRTAVILRRGWVMHTRSPGRSWLVRRLVPWIERERAAKLTEAVLCFAGGAALTAVSEPLGLMILGVFFSTFASEAIDAEALKRQRQRMSDQRIEIGQRADVYRDD